MFNDHHAASPTVIRKRLSFPSVLVLSIALIAMTVIVSASGIAIYGLRVVDQKADSIIGFAGSAISNLPEFRAALPAALADALNDERRPGYLEDLRISVRLREDNRYDGRHRAVVEVENQGDEIVSLLSMRIIGLDDEGDPSVERNTWAATPLQIDHEWRGPLLPRETRRFSVGCLRGRGTVTAAYEVTDIRVWRGGDPETGASTSLLSDITAAAD
jgi:hypothetical protein